MMEPRDQIVTEKEHRGIEVVEIDLPLMVERLLEVEDLPDHYLELEDRM